jgi:hypothetical protein
MDTMHLESTEGWVADAHNQQKRRYYMPFYTQIHMLVVHEAVPARNAAEFVVLARAQLGARRIAQAQWYSGDFFAKIVWQG